MIIIHDDIQSLRAHKKAVPLSIQNSGFLSVGHSMDMTKLVECPVVESVPAL